MDSENTVKELALDIIYTLKDRSGFTGWWDDIDEDTQDDIINDLVDTVKTWWEKT